MRTSYKQLALEYQDRFCAAVADYKRENELRLFYEKDNKQLKEKLKTVTEAADSTMDHMQYYEKQYKELEKENSQLKAQVEKMKCCQNCKNEGDYKEPYRYGTGWCNICKRHKVAKGNFDKWELQED